MHNEIVIAELEGQLLGVGFPLSPVGEWYPMLSALLSYLVLSKLIKRRH